MDLRPYQAEAVEAVENHLRCQEGNPVVVLPTGAGKTHVLADLCGRVVDRGGRVLVLSHVKELLAQAESKLRATAPGIDVGIYSAGLGRRDLDHSVLIAGIQSIYRRADEVGPVDLIVIDEAHLVPPEGDGQYRSFLSEMQAANPSVRMVGLTATPFRTSTGPICSPDGILNHICYEAGVRDLITDGYLCPLVTKAGIQKPDFNRLHIRGGEFIAGEVAAMMGENALVQSAVDEVVGYTQDRASVLLFASGVEHGEQIVNTFQWRHGISCGFVTGETPGAERDEILRRFQSGELKYLANVGVLTTGFDAPKVDCVALLRPTMSPGLFCQMVGRGFRLHPDKANCLVLDFGGNAMRHGPVDALTLEALQTEKKGKKRKKGPAKECPECRSVIPVNVLKCPDCGHDFPSPDRRKHDQHAADVGVLSDDWQTETHQVIRTWYVEHEKKNAPINAPKTLRVSYEIGHKNYVSEWISVEHTGRARFAAENWWQKRCDEPLPETAWEAVEIARRGGLAKCSAITTRTLPGQKFPKIVQYELGQIPQTNHPGRY